MKVYELNFETKTDRMDSVHVGAESVERAAAVATEMYPDKVVRSCWCKGELLLDETDTADE